jgi:regulator of cell morphogenesis and NO signaling
MSTIQSSVSLAELVIFRPELASRFDALGLDYCCGGQRSLGDAVASAGLDLTATIAALQELSQAPEPPQDWDGIGGLVDHLEATHHAYLTTALPRLVALADKVAQVHGANHPELVTVAKLVHELRADLEPHLLKEERVLFPMIRELAEATEAPAFHCGTLSNPIRMMLSEHDNVGELLAKLREVAGDYKTPEDGCASYQALYVGLAELEADTHMHVHKENNVLFPAVIEAENALSAGAQ